ncbi:MAG: nucleotidyltransferase family protein [Anaerolineales bacterium]|nr:nucleotidyltransferase family protein [Anaerolineales bacterium]
MTRKPDKIDPELNFIKQLLTRELFPGSSVSGLGETLDWKRLYDDLGTQRLSPFFSWIGKRHAYAWPEDFTAQLHKDRCSARIYGDRCALRIRELLSAVRSAKIPVVVLKGWAYIPLFYGKDHSLRICEDIDLLIYPGDADALEAIALNLGLELEQESWPGYSRRYSNGRSFFYPAAGEYPRDGFWISAHWGLFRKPYFDPGRVDLEALFERARPVNVAGVDVLALSPEDDLVYACAHLGLHHGYDQRLFRYYEMARLVLEARESLDWEAVLLRAEAWQIILPVQTILHRLEALWPGLAPQSVLAASAQMIPGRLETFTAAWNWLTKGRPIFDHPLVWITYPDWRQRPLILLQDLFPGRGYMLWRYGPAPGGFWPLLYFVRLFRAVLKIFGFGL